jgi:cell division protein FtsL
MPARRTEVQEPPRRAPLHLVTTPPARSARASARARARAEEKRARTAFMIFASVVVFAVVLGGARVSLITKAAEASLSESSIQASIKSQRNVADQLEVDRSALSTPSRIASIASATMKMGEPRSVRYISLHSSETSTTGGTSGVSVASAASTSMVDRVIGAVMDLSAGEAQSLLVGDLGLAGSR